MPERSSASPDLDAIFSRSVDLLGAEGFAALRRAFVVVLGLGGVGSHAAAALARSGVGRLRLVDFDRLTASSLNRHVCAVAEEVGQGKAEVLARRLRAVSPAVQIQVREAFFAEESADELLDGAPDLVVDAIDSLGPKVALLRCCVERELPVVSCMGASARTNPLLLRVDDIAATRICPLARAVRRRLHRFGITTGITAVYSVEAARPPLPPDEEEETLQRGRVRNRLPSLGYMPGIFGYAAAGAAIARLAGMRWGEPR